MKWYFPKEIIHPDDMERFGKRDYEKFNEYYKNKYRIAKKVKPEMIVEIGVRAGYSAFAFLSACPKAIYYGFDNNKGIDGGTKGLKFYEWTKKILKNKKIIIDPDFNTQEAYKLPLKFEPDLMHVDADHSYAGCLHDLELAKTHNAKYILVDDIDYIKTVRDATEEFVKKYDLKVIKYEDCRGQYLIENIKAQTLEVL